MNIEFSKIKSPFHPQHDHLSDLAMRIQRKVGIEQQELFEKPVLKEPVLPRNPIQLSVEFGNSYVAHSPENTYIEMAEVDVEEEVSHTVIPEVSDRSEITPSGDTKLIEVAKSEIEDPVKVFEEDNLVKNTTDTVLAPESSQEEMEAEKIRSAEVERKRAEAAARYAALLDESRADYIPISRPIQDNTTKGLPWTNILGVVASLAAIATAWWVWNLLQAPASVEQLAESNRQVPATVIIKTYVPKNMEETTVALEELPRESQLVADLVIDEGGLKGIIQNNIFPHFTQMDEQSKVSMVEMENNGLLIMELEDDIFEDQWL